MLVAVYGSLKKGFPNHHVMERAGGTFIGKGTTVHNYAMVSMGGAFPAVDLTKEISPIHIELYRVESIKPLDTLEGYPSFYDREKVLVDVNTPFGDEVEEAWIYHIPEISNRMSLVEGGYWK